MYVDPEPIFIYASQDLTQGLFYRGYLGGKRGQARGETRALSVSAGHRFTSCKVNYSSHCQVSGDLTVRSFTRPEDPEICASVCHYYSASQASCIFFAS